MKTTESFWVFGSLGLGDHIVCNAIYRHYAELHKDKIVIIPCWEHNLAAIQWMLSDVTNIYFYPIETEQQLLTCKNSIDPLEKLCLGFYSEPKFQYDEGFHRLIESPKFNPVQWDSEFYRQAGLDPELKWSGFKLPDYSKVEFNLHGYGMPTERQMTSKIACHHDPSRGLVIKDVDHTAVILNPQYTLAQSCYILNSSEEIHCIDSSMLNLSDLLETPYCKRFVFHRYARKGLPPRLKKNWEILD